jgi:hypothetical protein
MKKEYDFSKMKELKNPYAGKKQAVGINLSPEVVDYFKGFRTSLPEVNRPLSSRLREKAQETDDEVGSVES